MRFTLSIALIFCFKIHFGQLVISNTEIYKGKKFPFTNCYVIFSDSLAFVEYHFIKASIVFASSETMILTHEKENKLSSFKDDIWLKIKSNHLVIKKKGYGRIKVHKTHETISDIIILRNKGKHHNLGHNLYRKCQQDSSCDFLNFWNKFNSYKLDKHFSLPEKEFDEKLKLVEKELSSAEKK